MYRYTTAWSSQTTFTGQVGSTKTLKVAVEFSDGTQLTDASAVAGYLSLDKIVASTSDVPDAISVASATATLRANHWRAVKITVGLYKLNVVAAQLESAQYQPLRQV